MKADDFGEADVSAANVKGAGTRPAAAKIVRVGGKG
jgi:hypothetical protein